MQIRRAMVSDASRVADLAMQLTRQHQSYNPLRFVCFDGHEEQMARFIAEQLSDPACVLLVAEHAAQTVGYALVRMEAGSIVDISESCAWLHDIYVDEAARGLKAGKMLLEASIAAARELGSNVLKLHVAPQNEFAQRLFESAGFQVTMREMMLDLGA